jgi:hypothetical protein
MPSTGSALATNNSLTALDLRENRWAMEQIGAITTSFGSTLCANTAMTDLKLAGLSQDFYDHEQFYARDHQHHGKQDEAQRQVCRWLGRNRARRYCDHGFTLACTTCHPAHAPGGSRAPVAKHSRQMGCCVKAPPYTPMTDPNAPSLTKIDVSRMMLGDDGLAVLASSISNIPTLTILDVSDNAMGSEGARSLSKALRSPASAVRSLILGNAHKQGDDKGDAAAPRLDRISCWSLQLTNRIGDAGATSLGQMLQTNTSLTELLMDPEIDRRLASHPYHAASREELMQPAKPKSITSAGIAALSAGVKVNEHLRVLVLDNLEVGDQVSKKGALDRRKSDHLLRRKRSY